MKKNYNRIKLQFIYKKIIQRCNDSLNNRLDDGITICLQKIVAAGVFKFILFFNVLIMAQFNTTAQTNADPNLLRSTDFLISRLIHNSVFYWMYDGGQATCFSVNYNGKKYLVTAKHNFTKDKNQILCWSNKNIKVKNGDRIKFSLKREPSPKFLEGNVYFHPNELIDIAVIKCDSNLNGGIFITSRTQYVISQSAYFLGFPYGLGTNSFQLNDGYPFAFIRKTIISSFSSQNDDLLGSRIFLDGHNNIGFSGGPVLYLNSKTNTVDLAGVIHGFLPVNQNFTSKQGDEFTYSENTGIVIAYDADYIIEIIDQLPKQ